MKKSILLPFYLCFLTFLFLGEVKLVSAQQPSCQATVTSVLNDMRSKGARVKYSILKQTMTEDFLYEFLGNTTRVDTILFDFYQNSFYSDFSNSKVLMKSYSSQIFSRCGGTGMVIFDEIEDGSHSDTFPPSFAMRDDGMLGVEECSYFGSPSSSISKVYHTDFGYCAYVTPDF